MTLSAQVAEQSDKEFLIGPSRVMRDIVDLVHKVAKPRHRADPRRARQGTPRAPAAPRIGPRRGAVHHGQRRVIPHELVESTLFGHEKGAFTGAHRQQLGKFELAAGGTLLDEIGDLRLDLQAKLLRAIQEGEIERVGGSKPIKTDFRLGGCDQRRSREGSQEAGSTTLLPDQRHPDSMPPASGSRISGAREVLLRPLPVEVPKQTHGISESTMKLLLSYWWPGNIRELENLIERLVAVGDKEWITDEDLPLDYHFARFDDAGRREREPVPGGVRHVRAELHHPGARTQRLERLRDRPLSWHSPC